MRRNRGLTASVVVAAGAVLLTACGDDGAPATTDDPADGDGTAVVDVYFVNQRAYDAGQVPYVQPVEREVPADDPIRGALDALFAGPTDEEAAAGMVLVASGATGVGSVSVTDRVARVRLEGGCDRAGAALSVVRSLQRTLRQFREVDYVKVLDPGGDTQDPDGASDSIPDCLDR